MAGPEREDTSQLPSNVETEQAILGSILFDNEAFHRVADVLQPHHFHEPFHQRLYEAMKARIRNGQLAEPIVVMDRFKDDAAFQELGGLRYLADLVDRAPPVANAPEYALTLTDLWTRREIIRIGAEMSFAARKDQKVTGLDILTGAERKLSDLASNGPVSEAWNSIGKLVDDQFARARMMTSASLPGLRMGIPDVDAVIGGLRPQTVNLLAGRPGMGKSAAGIVVGLNVASPSEEAPMGRGVAFFSLEMPAEQVATRFACAAVYDRWAAIYAGKSSNPTYEDFERGDLTEAQWRKLEIGRGIFDEMPIEIDFRSKLKVTQMTAAVRRLKRRWAQAGIPPGVIIIDHVLHVGADGGNGKVEEITRISNDILDMAKSLDMPVLLLCQLSRSVEGRDDKRPNLSDLKWAGALEEDAFSVTFLYRPEYYIREPTDENDDKGWKKHAAETRRWEKKLLWLVEKNRGGRSGQQLETYCSIGHNVIRNLIEAKPEGVGSQFSLDPDQGPF